MPINTTVFLFWTLLFTDGTMKEVYVDPSLTQKPVNFYVYVNGDASKMQYVENSLNYIDGALHYVWEAKND